MSRRTVLWRGLRIWLATLAGVAALVPVAAAANSTGTVRDEFTTIAYDGDNGTQDWNDAWVEFPLGDGPDAGNVRVVA